MLAEINHCASRLELPIDFPIAKEDLRIALIAPPKEVGYQSRFDTDDYSFCFGPSGKLRYIINMRDDRGEKTVREYQKQLSKIQATINTNDAYRIATNWLVALDVDLAKLEKGNPPLAQQRYYFDSTLESNRVTVNIPLFDVKWGNWRKPTVQVLVSGVNGKLLRLRQENDSYSRRPTVLIKDMKKLLQISDEEFLKYSGTERTNLVERFAAIDYSQQNPHSNSSAGR